MNIALIIVNWMPAQNFEIKDGMLWVEFQYFLTWMKKGHWCEHVCILGCEKKPPPLMNKDHLSMNRLSF